MITYRAPQTDLQFCYFDVFDGYELSRLEGWEDVSPELYGQILDAAARLTETIVDPLRLSGHEEGVHFVNGVVTTPKGFPDAYRAYAEGGWPGLSAAPEYGGQGLPYSFNLAIKEMMCTANHSLASYPHLSGGAVNALTKWASNELKETYLPRLISGEWAGTMCLTEAHCGSDLGLLRTRAEPCGDGSYALTGQKIFITGGEQDLTDNIVHLVLARLPDAPAGVKGISLFVVPKFQLDENSMPGATNNVTCGSVEHKMGLNGSATCTMNFDGAIGHLVGAPHRGLQAMFTMMNSARLGTGIGGLSGAEGAYQHALAYARERLQGRSLRGAVNPDGPADPIITHPDVRRMLLQIRSVAEAGRAFVTWIGQQIDFANRHPEPSSRMRSQALVDLLTPVIKAFITDMSFEATVLGQQVFGGHGYIREHGIEQFVRDTRITQIYEGANGIQGLDLLGRKMPRDDGLAVTYLLEEFDKVSLAAWAHPETAEMAHVVGQAKALLRDTLTKLQPRISGDPAELGAASADFLHLTGHAVFACLWTRMAIAALSVDDASFRAGKLATARFYLTRLFPRAHAHAAAATAGAQTVVDLADDAF